MNATRTLAEQLVEQLVCDDETYLRGLGMTVAESGGLSWPGGRLWIHTDFGSLSQDKDCNQDYALAWRASDGLNCTVKWVVAVADGLTSSFRSEWGSRLACWSGIAGLLRSGALVLPHDRLRAALNAVGDRIGVVADAFEDDFAVSRPPDLFPATWRYILREGLLLQTTFTLVWCEQESVYLGIVGDGGACSRVRCGTTADRFQLLAAPPLDMERVHALGPRNRRLMDVDSWHELDVSSVSQIAICTDGLARGLTNCGKLLLGDLDTIAQRTPDNPVREFIVEKVREQADAFGDNLTLAWILLD